MATAQTKGFALQGLPSGPRIPQNIGQIDVGAIIDSTKKGLEVFEAVRRQPQSMALADATLAAQTAQQPLAARAALAQTEGIEQQTPLNTAILAERASPERMALERDALRVKSQPRPLTGTPFLLKRVEELRADVAANPTDPAALAALADAQQALNKQQQVAPSDPSLAIKSREQVAAANADAAMERARMARDVRVSEGALNREATAANTALRADTSQDVARIGAQGRVDAAKAATTAKLYETAAEKNEKVESEMAALGILNDRAEQYLGSFLGAGVVAGSAPVIAVRSILGDDTGKDFAAAISQNMRSAVETMRGLGAMSEREFAAAMAQLPTLNEPEPAIRTKLGYLNALRPWILARNRAFMDELAKGNSPMLAHEKVRISLPMPAIDGVATLSVPVPQNVPNAAQSALATTPAAQPVSFATPEAAEAAGAAGQLQPGQAITVGGRPAVWNP